MEKNTAPKITRVGITLTAHEKSELARFTSRINNNATLEAECSLLAALPAGSMVTTAAFDRCMTAYRAWLVFGTQP